MSTRKARHFLCASVISAHRRLYANLTHCPQFDDGDVVGHHIFSLEESRRHTAARKNGKNMSNMHHSSLPHTPTVPGSPSVPKNGDEGAYSVPRGPQDGKDVWLRRNHASVANREEQVNQQVRSLSCDLQFA